MFGAVVNYSSRVLASKIFFRSLNTYFCNEKPLWKQKPPNAKGLKRFHPCVQHIQSNCLSEYTGSKAIRILASPRVCLHDVPTAITITGLEPHQDVTLRSSITTDRDKKFASHAHYRSDERGNLDLRYSPSLGGDFKGVYPSGLLTALKPAPGEYKFARLIFQNAMLPWQIAVAVHPGHGSCEEKNEPLARLMLERYSAGPGVRRIPVRVGRVRGALYLPPGNGPFPGVVDMFGLVGGLWEFRAALSASHGFASLALAYFNYDDLPKEALLLELDYFEEAVNYLLNRPEVIPDCCGVLGICVGGYIATLMGAYLDKVKAVISINGASTPLGSDWSYKGKKIFSGYKMSTRDMNVDDDLKVTPRPEAISQWVALDHPQIVPLELADEETYFLFIGGLADPFGSCEGFQYLLQRLKKGEKERNATIVNYENTGHIIEPPYFPFTCQAYQPYFPYKEGVTADQGTGINMFFGGKIDAYAAAQEDMWKRAVFFLNHHVKHSSKWYEEWLTKHSRA